jgi:hypothetical protein
MVYQALFSGHAGQDSTIVRTQATVLINMGATQNFAGDRYVKRHDLHCFPATPMTVALADGKRLVADRMVAMTLQFGKYRYVQNVYVLPLGVSADIILGMPWLYSLGEFTCNMRNHELSFVHRASHGRQERIVLRAQPGAPKLAQSKVLPYGQAIHQIRLAQRLQRMREGPTVEQCYAVRKAARQGSTNLYGYDLEDDPRNPNLGGEDKPWAYLCYLLPSRDKEGEKGGAEQQPATSPPKADPRAAQGDATEDGGLLAPLREQSKADPRAAQGDATEKGGLLAPLREQSKADPRAAQGDATEKGPTGPTP